MKHSMVSFGDVVRNVDESVRDPQTCGLDRYVGLEHIDPESLHIQRWGLIADGTTFTRRFRKGQVLFGKRRAYQRKVAVAEFDGLCSSDILVFEPKDERLLPELLPFLCQTESFFEHALDTSAGSLSPRTKFKELARYEFPLPPLEEQRCIAEILLAVEDVLKKYIALIPKLEEFSGSLWKQVKNNSSQNYAKLQDIADIRNGSTPKRNVEKYWNGNIPWLPTNKVNDRIILKADELISNVAFEETNLKIVPANSSLIAMIGEGKTRGKVAFLTFDACINQNFACVIPRTIQDSWYLFFCLDNMYDELRSLSQGGVGALNCSLVKGVKVPYPPIEDRVRLGEIFKGVENRRNEILLHKEKSSSLKLSLINALIDS